MKYRKPVLHGFEVNAAVEGSCANGSAATYTRACETGSGDVTGYCESGGGAGNRCSVGSGDYSFGCISGTSPFDSYIAGGAPSS